MDLKYKKLYTLHIALKVFHTYIGTLSILENWLLENFKVYNYNFIQILINVQISGIRQKNY